MTRSLSGTIYSKSQEPGKGHGFLFVGVEPIMNYLGWKTLGMTRKPYPSGVPDDE
jgi:hypothetical protein